MSFVVHYGPLFFGGKVRGDDFIGGDVVENISEDLELIYGIFRLEECRFPFGLGIVARPCCFPGVLPDRAPACLPEELLSAAQLWWDLAVWRSQGIAFPNDNYFCLGY